MSNDINRVVLIGRIVSEPVLRYTQGGTAITSFSIANNRRWKSSDGEKTESVSFFNCTAWGALGEKVISVYGKKGMQVAIEGRIEQQRWEKDGEKKSKIEIIVENFQFLSGKKEEGGAVRTDVQEPEQTGAMDNNPFGGDDIPF